MISDQFGRRFSYLRLGLTEACNFACQYCVENTQIKQVKNPSLSEEELFQLVKMLHHHCQFSQLRITGGEPLIAPIFDGLLNCISVLDIAKTLTTNGLLLTNKLSTIIASGVSRINVSIDALNEQVFNQMARSRGLERVLAGIRKAKDAGLKVKLNTVPMRGVNDQEIVPLLEFAKSEGIEIRFIELMKMGHLYRNEEFHRYFMPMEEIVASIAKHYKVQKLDRLKYSTSERYSIIESNSQSYQFGVIANESAPFCRDCNRLRLNSNGMLFGCLSNNQSFDLKHLLHLEADKASQELATILAQSLKHKQKNYFKGEHIIMRSIGG